MSLTTTEKQFGKLVTAILDQHSAAAGWVERLKPRKVARAFGQVASRAELCGDLSTYHAAAILEDTWLSHANARDEYERLMRAVRRGDVLGEFKMRRGRVGS